MKKSNNIILAFIFVFALPAFQKNVAQTVLTPADLLSLESCNLHQLSPDGTEIIYSVLTPRGPNEKPGSAHRKYYRMNLENQTSTPLFAEDFKAGSLRYSPDGAYISFTHKPDEGKTQVYAMPAGGGDRVQLTDEENGVSDYRWKADGNGLAYLSKESETKREQQLKERGYGFIFYEENLKNNRLFLLSFGENFETNEKRQLLKGTHVWDFEFSPDGQHLAFSSSDKNLIDHRYMFRRLQILDLASGEVVKKVGNEGKLGNYAFSPDGTQLAFASALNINDHAVSQAFTYSLEDETTTNHTPEDFKGHMSWVGWKNNTEIYAYAGEGVYPTFSAININNSNRTVVFDAETMGIIFNVPEFTEDGSLFVFTGNTPYDPSNIYKTGSNGSPEKLTNLNPELDNTLLGEQEVIHYNARDGQEIEGLLIKPVDYREGQKYPLILYVHGGPESHHDNGWLSRYSTPGQVMAGKGYLVAYINYRASTGYGVDFAMEGFMDPAGTEFDDLADGIDYLVAEHGADKDRVGMAGGSYGGYASAWFATYYTDKVRAVCMFVGISNVISKRGTTDIAYEELLVHSGKPLEEQWEMNLQRSPIYWAHQSKTATLIYGGADDTRVHPSQSYELYRIMVMNDHPAVRLVQYPGEGHGNRKQPGQIDVLYRQINWLDWYVKDAKPLDGPMPPLDISDEYGLDWDW
ncbi:MAG: prolyl oligopeptidase family serine peptidase [Bacteroidota bacterium]